MTVALKMAGACLGARARA